MKKKIIETASSGATSAGAIASTPGLNFPLQKRIPPTELFGYSEYKIDKDSKKKK